MDNNWAYIKARWAPVFTAVMTVLVALGISGDASAAYRVLRPSGPVLQTKLFGVQAHRGMDFIVSDGTPVYAVSDGVVVGLREDIAESTCPNVAFGNYVLVKNSRQHYVRQNNGTTIAQNGYVYTTYAHLKQNSVPVTTGQSVTMGQQIGQVNRTGSPCADLYHLHLQIDVDTNGTRAAPDLAWTEIYARNPEIWYQPYQNGANAIAVGKVTNTSGVPQGGLYICGMNKPAGAQYYSFVGAVTYNSTWVNPDDILVENFGTTDIVPGTYHLYARSTNCAGSVYRDLGNYTFVAGRNTYIGLFPMFFPDVKPANGGWSAQVALRNTSATYASQTISTFLNGSAVVGQARTDLVAAGSSLEYGVVSSSVFEGIVVPSQPTLGLIHNLNISTGNDYAYLAWPASRTSNTIFINALYNNYYSWYSQMYIQNTGNGPTNVDVQFFDSNGGGAGTTACPALRENASCAVGGGIASVTSARITASDPTQLLAVSVQHNNGGVAEGFRGFSTGSTNLYAPVIMKDYYDWDTALTIQNIGNSATTIYVDYYDEANNFVKTTTLPNVPSMAFRELYSPADLTNAGIYSAHIRTSGQPAVATVTESWISPIWPYPLVRGEAYEAMPVGATQLRFPVVKSVVSSDNWVSSIVVQNVGFFDTTVTLTLSNGTTLPSGTIRPKGLYQWYLPNHVSGFNGTATVQSNTSAQIVAIINHTAVAHSSQDWAFTYEGQ